MVAAGPHTGNSLSVGMSSTLVNANAQSQYDNLAGKPASNSQNGGSLLKRLEKLAGKKRKYKSTYRKKKI